MADFRGRIVALAATLLLGTGATPVLRAADKPPARQDYDQRFQNDLNCRLAVNRYQPPNLAVSLDTGRPPEALPLVIRSDQGKFRQDWVYERNNSYMVRVNAQCEDLRSYFRVPGLQLIALYQGQLKTECAKKVAGDQPACRTGLQDRIARIHRALDPPHQNEACDPESFKQILIGLRHLPGGMKYLHGFEARNAYALKHLELEARKAFNRPWQQPSALDQKNLPPNPFVDDHSYDAQLRSSEAFRGKEPVGSKYQEYPPALLAYRSVLEQCAPSFPDVMKHRISQIDRMFGPPPKHYDPAKVLAPDEGEGGAESGGGAGSTSGGGKSSGGASSGGSRAQ